MAKYILKSALMVIPTMLAVVFIVFTINYFTPGDPVAVFYDFDYTEEQYAEKAAEWGLDQPFLVQFYNYVKNIVTKFDFGYSYFSGNSVMSELSTRFPVSLRLGLISVLLTVVIGVPFGFCFFGCSVDAETAEAGFRCPEDGVSFLGAGAAFGAYILSKSSMLPMLSPMPLAFS